MPRQTSTATRDVRTARPLLLGVAATLSRPHHRLRLPEGNEKRAELLRNNGVRIPARPPFARQLHERKVRVVAKARSPVGLGEDSDMPRGIRRSKLRQGSDHLELVHRDHEAAPPARAE